MGQRAIVVYPDGPTSEAWLDRCLAHCRRREYDVVALVRGLSRWGDAVTMIQDHEAEVIVVSSRRHLDPARTPRLESTTEDLTGRLVPGDG